MVTSVGFSTWHKREVPNNVLFIPIPKTHTHIYIYIYITTTSASSSNLSKKSYPISGPYQNPIVIHNPRCQAQTPAGILQGNDEGTEGHDIHLGWNSALWWTSINYIILKYILNCCIMLHHFTNAHIIESDADWHENKENQWCSYSTCAAHNQHARSMLVLQAFAAKPQEKPSSRCCWSSSHPFGLGERVHSPSISGCNMAAPWIGDWCTNNDSYEWFLVFLGDTSPRWTWTPSMAMWLEPVLQNASLRGPMAVFNRAKQIIERWHRWWARRSNKNWWKLEVWKHFAILCILPTQSTHE